MKHALITAGIVLIVLAVVYRVPQIGDVVMGN